MLLRVLGCAALLACAPVSLIAAYRPGTATLHAVTPLSPVLDVAFGMNHLAWPFFVAIAIVAPAAALWTLQRGRAGEGLMLALFVATMLLVLCARSVAAFVLAWECMTLVSAFLVAARGEARFVRRATLAYVVMSQIGTLCIIVAFALLGSHAATLGFDAIERASAHLPAATRGWVLALALVGFGSKAGLVPLHFWLPRAHPAAPASASAVLSGLMLAIAIYGLAELFFVLAAPAPLAFGVVLTGVGLLSAGMGGLYAAVEGEIKRLLAYSSIENVGIVVAALGLAAAASAVHESEVAAAALIAALFQMVAHAIFKSLLFLAAGTVYESSGTLDLEHLGGLFRQLRFTTPLVFIGLLAASALPPASGFASEWLVFQAFAHAMTGGPLLLRATAATSLIALATGSALAMLAYVKMFGIGFLGAGRSTHVVTAERLDLSAAGLAWLAAFALALGIAPMLLARRLSEVVGMVTAAGPFHAGALPVLPVAVAALPAAAAIGALLCRRKRTRTVATWRCGSSQPPRAQYTATAFANPIMMIYKRLLLPERAQTLQQAATKWYPRGITSTVRLRYVVDETMRGFASIVQRVARRLRIVQGGLLRVYLGYAVLALIAVLMVAK